MSEASMVVHVVFLGLVAFVPVRRPPPPQLQAYPCPPLANSAQTGRCRPPCPSDQNPLPPAAKSPPPTEFRVLLPDTPGGQYASDGCPLPQHVPAVFVLAGSCRIQDAAGWQDCTIDSELLRDFGPTMDCRISSFRLKHTEITFDWGGPADPGTLPSSQAGKADRCPDEGNAEDPHWIPTFEEMDQVDLDCLEGAGCPLAGRVKISGGYLKTCSFIQTAEGQPAQYFHFQAKYSSIAAGLPWVFRTQAVSDGAKIDVTVPFGPIKLQLRDMNLPYKARDITLTPLTEQGAKPEITIWVVNIPPEPEDVGDPCYKVSLDKHYEIYLDLQKRGEGGLPMSLGNRPQASMANTCDYTPKMTNACPFLGFNPDPPYGTNPAGNDRTHCGNLQFAQVDENQ